MAADDSSWKNDFLSFTAGLSLYAKKVLTNEKLEEEFERWRRVTGRRETNDQLKAVLTNQITTAPYLYLTRAKMLFSSHTAVLAEFESELKDNNVTIEMDASRFITKCPMLTDRSLSVSGGNYKSEEMYDFLSFLTESSRTAKEMHDMKQLRTKYVEASKTYRTNIALETKFIRNWSKEIEGLDALLVTKAMLLYATSVPFSEEFYKEKIAPSFPAAEVSFNITKFVSPKELKQTEGEFKLQAGDKRGRISKNGSYPPKLENAMIDYLVHVSKTNSLKMSGKWEELIPIFEKTFPNLMKLQVREMTIYFRMYLAPCIFKLDLDINTKIKMLLASNTTVTKEQLDSLRAEIGQVGQYKLEVTVNFEKPPATFEDSIERKFEDIKWPDDEYNDFMSYIVERSRRGVKIEDMNQLYKDYREKSGTRRSANEIKNQFENVIQPNLVDTIFPVRTVALMLHATQTPINDKSRFELDGLSIETNGERKIIKIIHNHVQITDDVDVLAADVGDIDIEDGDEDGQRSIYDIPEMYCDEVPIKEEIKEEPLSDDE